MSRALIRTSLWLAAAGAAFAAAAVSAANNDSGFVPLFLILGVAGLVAAWADRWSGSGRLGIVVVGVAVGWVGMPSRFSSFWRGQKPCAGAVALSRWRKPSTSEWR